MRNALQAIDSARQRLQFSRLRRQSAEEQFRSEGQRFQQLQLTLVTSQSQVNRAEADLSEAISLLEFARGTNYKRHHVYLK